MCSITSFMNINSNTFLRSDIISAFRCVEIISKINDTHRSFIVTQLAKYPGDDFQILIEIYWDLDWIGVDVLSKVSRCKLYSFSFDPSINDGVLNKLSQFVNLNLISNDLIEINLMFDDINRFIFRIK